MEAGVDLISCAVQEACVDEEDACVGFPDALAQVDAGPPLLVHDPHLDRVAAEAEEFLGDAEEAARERDLLRAVLLRLHDVQGAGAAVHVVPGAAQVVQRGRHRDEAVDEALRRRLPVLRHDHVGEHVVADVADQGDGAARDGGGLAGGVAEPDVAIHPPGHRLAVLHEGRLQRTAKHAGDVAVDLGLVLGVHRRHRVLHVEDGGQRGLDHDVLDAALRGRTHAAGLVDHEDEVQVVVLQEDLALVRHGGSRAAGRQRGDPAIRVRWPQHAGVADE
mmetsp:Transcript_22541/g.57464  ORF Transcript_22541/g.57464 Transcript_22541/m.57464 type:complete len:276 (+) Transcript_22541:912-1739(+)